MFNSIKQKINFFSLYYWLLRCNSSIIANSKRFRFSRENDESSFEQTSGFTMQIHARAIVRALQRGAVWIICYHSCMWAGQVAHVFITSDALPSLILGTTPYTERIAHHARQTPSYTSDRRGAVPCIGHVRPRESESHWI